MKSVNLRVFKMSFASVYPLYVQKAERKGRKKEEVDELAKGRPMAKILGESSHG
jgi:hypothetical protein